MGKGYAALVLLLRFVQVLLMSGVGTLLIILRYWRRRNALPETAFIRLEITPMSERGAVMMAAMITLTPGTTTIHIDMENHELLIHVLDARDLTQTVAQIRRDFEAPLAVLCGRECAV